ncbi:MAG: GGDEF domain-containing protein [Actinomycetota bacterium]|nr:GGDEF domain-containing protein [Actinomycetota bacterium]
MLKPGSKTFNFIISIAVIVAAAFMVITQKDFLALNLIYFALVPAALAGGAALLMVVLASIFIGIVYAGLSLPQVLVFVFPLAFTGAMVMILKTKIDMLSKEFGDISLVDPVTGLYNYVYFKDRLKEEKERSDRFGSKISVIMAKIDNPPGEMDGHLKQVADIINEQVRAVDVVSRYGADKFAVILPNTSSEAAEIAERIRDSIEAADFDGAKITVSLGLATYPANADDEKILIERVEGALKSAIEAGKNRVVVYKD